MSSKDHGQRDRKWTSNNKQQSVLEVPSNQGAAQFKSQDGFSKDAESAEISARVGQESDAEDEFANKLSLGFGSLNEDFSLPEEWQLVKKLGKGAYGKVMEVIHLPTGRQYACKRFEHVFVNDQRARRLLREISILKRLSHPCLNKMICVLTPESVHESKVRRESLRNNSRKAYDSNLNSERGA